MGKRATILENYHAGTLKRSVEINRATIDLFPHHRFISPFDVMRALTRAKIRFVLIGSFGLCGWRKQARAAAYPEVLVGRSTYKKASAILLETFSKLEAKDSKPAVCLLDTVKRSVAVKIVKPVFQPYREVWRHAETVECNTISYRIPILEMALALTYADMTGPHTELAEKHQAAHDFICIVKSNQTIDDRTLTKLEAIIPPDGGNDLVDRVKSIQKGEKLVI